MANNALMILAAMTMSHCFCYPAFHLISCSGLQVLGEGEYILLASPLGTKGPVPEQMCEIPREMDQLSVIRVVPATLLYRAVFKSMCPSSHQYR